MIINGTLIGLMGAAAIGPIAFIIIQRTISQGKTFGFASGVGVALADAIYGLIGGLGLTLITEFMIGNQSYLRIIGGITLIWLGIQSFRSPVANKVDEEPSSKSGLFAAGGSIFLLTLSNPITILYFAAVYVGMGSLGILPSVSNALQFSIGIFIGSYLWWILLVLIANWFKSKITPAKTATLNKISGSAIAGFGIWIIASLYLP